MKFIGFSILFFLLIIRLWAAERQMPPPAEELDRELGIPLFSGGGIWHGDYTALCRRFAALKIQLPVPAAGACCVNADFPSELEIFGIGVRELRVITEKRDGKDYPVQVDFVFTNKGDSAGNRRLKSAIRREGRKIDTVLDALCGPARPVNYGPRELDLKVDFRQTADTLWLVENVRREYTVLHLCPLTDVAELSARTPRISGAVLAEQVRRSELGDVVITGIPMVNQGPKGYCVPATLERILLYYGIRRVNMHRIADLCGTERGGGTYMRRVNESLDGFFGRLHLRTESFGALGWPQLKKYLSAGVPVLWPMFYSDELAEFRRQYTAARSRCQSLKELKKLTRSAISLRGTGEAHVCLIVGFNDKSGEIAVSDSWGGDGAAYWLPMKIARGVTQADCYAYVPGGR